MNEKSKLLDAAKKVCLSDAETARRLGVTRGLIAMWRAGHPMPQDRVTQLARIAQGNTGFWLAAIAAEQSSGDTRRAWERVAASLANAALVVLALGLSTTNVRGQVPNSVRENPAMSIMSRLFCVALTLATLAWRAASRKNHARDLAAALLA